MGCASTCSPSAERQEGTWCVQELRAWKLERGNHKWHRAVAAVSGVTQFLGSGCGQQSSLGLWFLPSILLAFLALRGRVCASSAGTAVCPGGRLFCLVSQSLLRPVVSWLLVWGLVQMCWLCWCSLLCPMWLAALQPAEVLGAEQLHAFLAWRWFLPGLAEGIAYVFRATGRCLCFHLPSEIVFKGKLKVLCSRRQGMKIPYLEKNCCRARPLWL